MTLGCKLPVRASDGTPTVTYGTGGSKFILGMPLLLTEHNPQVGQLGDVLLR